MIVFDYQPSPRVRRILQVFARISCPSQLVELNLEGELHERVVFFLRTMPPVMRTALVIGLHVFDQSAALHPSHGGKKFCELSPEQAEHWFALWWNSSVELMKEFAHKTAAVVNMNYYELPVVRHRIDYRPEDWITKVTQRRLARYGEEIRQKEAALFHPDPLPRARKEAP